MNFRVYLLFLSVCFCCLSCGQASSSSNTLESSSNDVSQYKKFDEEFFNGTTIKEFRDFQVYLTDITIFDVDVPGRTQEEEDQYTKCVRSVFEDYQNYYINAKTAKYSYRDYYSAFYFYKRLFVHTNYYDESWKSFITFTSRDYIDDFQDDTPYNQVVKFNNYLTKDEIPSIYEDFHLYCVIHLVDIFVEDELLTTSFVMENFMVLKNGDICFYDLPLSFPHNDYFQKYMVPFDEQNKYLVYYDENLYSKYKISPFYPKPKDATTPMITRSEIDEEYYYYPIKVVDSKDDNPLVKEITILQYNKETQKSELKTIYQLYSRERLPKV